MTERIYIAGQYSPKKGENLHNASRITTQNVSKAITAANRLIEQGHFVCVPVLSHYIHIHDSCKKNHGSWWYEQNNTFLEHWATAIYMLNNWVDSKGAKNELKLAQDLGLKIMFEDD